MSFEHARALVEPRLILRATLRLIWREAQISQRRSRCTWLQFPVRYRLGRANRGGSDLQDLEARGLKLHTIVAHRQHCELIATVRPGGRSEERRVGKECRS